MNYYTVLGVSRSSSQEEIKKAYRQKAKLYHPDVSTESNAEQKFKTVKEAYDTLSDNNLKFQYDQNLERGYSSTRNNTYTQSNNNYYQSSYKSNSTNYTGTNTKTNSDIPLIFRAIWGLFKWTFIIIGWIIFGVLMIAFYLLGFRRTKTVYK